MTIFVKLVCADLQFLVSFFFLLFLRLSVGDVIFFIKRGYVPYLVIFFLTSKTLSKPSPKFHQDPQPNSNISSSNSGFKTQSQASILHSNLHQGFSKVEVCGFDCGNFPFHKSNHLSFISTSSLWVLMVIYELLKYGITTTHPIMVYFAYYHEMKLLCDVYGFHASTIKL